jgi:type IV secretory pathway VirB2 component (pilin)
MKRFFLTSCLALAAIAAAALAPIAAFANGALAETAETAPAGTSLPDLVTGQVLGEVLTIVAIVALVVLLYLIFAPRDRVEGGRIDPSAPFRPGQPKPPD